MIKQYIKTTPVTAEQWTGSQEMGDKYNLYISPWGDTLLSTLEGNMRLDYGDYIVTGIKGEHWAINEKTFEKTYKEVKDTAVSYDQLLRVHNNQTNTIKELIEDNEKLQDEIEELENRIDMYEDEEWSTSI